MPSIRPPYSVLVRIVVLAVVLGCPPAPEVANVITAWDAKAGIQRCLTPIDDAA